MLHTKTIRQTRGYTVLTNINIEINSMLKAHVDAHKSVANFQHGFGCLIE